MYLLASRSLGLLLAAGGTAALAPQSLELAIQTLNLSLELVVRRRQLGYGLFCEQLLERPLFDILGLILLQLGDEHNGTL